MNPDQIVRAEVRTGSRLIRCEQCQQRNRCPVDGVAPSAMVCGRCKASLTYPFMVACLKDYGAWDKLTAVHRIELRNICHEKAKK